MVGKPYGYYYVSGADTVEGMPTDDQAWWFLWYVPSGIWAFSYATNTVWRAEFINDYLYGWREVAFADPPQEFDLPFVEGVTGNAKYFKTQEGNVQIIISAASKTAWGSEELIGTLPEGYRPQDTLYFPVIVEDGQSIIGSCSMRVAQDGNIRTAGYAVSGVGKSLCGFASFVV